MKVIPVTQREAAKKIMDIKFLGVNFPKSLKKLRVNEYPTVSGSFTVPPAYNRMEMAVSAKYKRTPYLGTCTMNNLL